MSAFEIEVRAMLTQKEIALLDRVLAGNPARDGAIASLVARTLRQMDESGLIDLLHPEAK